MKSINKVGKPKSIRNIAYSILILFMIVASLTGATYAWFIASSANIENVFTAGTVELSNPQIKSVVTVITPGSNIAFVPNSGEASVSKVNLNTKTEIARYYTAPRLGNEIDLNGNSNQGNPNSIDPYDWRTSRMAQDDFGNAWILNTGVDGTGLQGSVVRIQSDTSGLNTTNNDPNNPLLFGTDEAVKVIPVGNIGEMPRAIAIDDDGYIWIGFYGSGRLVKYQYSSNTLNLQEQWTLSGIGFYEMKFAPNGDLYISSRQSTSKVSRPGINSGIYIFNGTNIVAENTSFNSYSLLISADGTVYATSFDSKLHIRNPDGDWSSVNITGSSQNRGMAFDNGGNIWIASTVNTSTGTHIYSYNVTGQNTGPFYSLPTGTGTTPVGIGKDKDGNMWAVCRTDGDTVGGYIEGFNPINQETVGSIKVGFRPYAYGDFTKPGRTCKTVEWEFEVTGTKSAYVRVKPTEELNGSDVTINLYENNSNWRKGLDGDEWWYYGSESGPLVIPPSAGNDSKVNVVFEYCIPDDSNPGFEVTLIAEAVQSTHGAIDTIWQTNPWR